VGRRREKKKSCVADHARLAALTEASSWGRRGRRRRAVIITTPGSLRSPRLP
jgi:hypothetical protein